MQEESKEPTNIDFEKEMKALASESKLLTICQFMSMFRHVMKIYPTSLESDNSDSLMLHTEDKPYYSETNRLITPDELSHSIIYPHVDPLVGQIVSRLLAKARPTKVAYDKAVEEEEIVLTPYDMWNENLAKKWSVLYKNYQKFKNRFIKPSSEEGKEDADFDVSNNLQSHILEIEGLHEKENMVFTKFEHENSI